MPGLVVPHLDDNGFCEKSVDFRLVKFYAFPLNYGGGAVA